VKSGVMRLQTGSMPASASTRPPAPEATPGLAPEKLAPTALAGRGRAAVPVQEPAAPIAPAGDADRPCGLLRVLGSAAGAVLASGPCRGYGRRLPRASAGQGPDRSGDPRRSAEPKSRSFGSFPVASRRRYPCSWLGISNAPTPLGVLASGPFRHDRGPNLELIVTFGQRESHLCLSGYAGRSNHDRPSVR
jgi:hypothetical protein